MSNLEKWLISIEPEKVIKDSSVFEHKIINFVKTVEQKVKNPPTSQHRIPTKVKAPNK